MKLLTDLSGSYSNIREPTFFNYGIVEISLNSIILISNKLQLEYLLIGTFSHVAFALIAFISFQSVSCKLYIKFPQQNRNSEV